MATQVFTKAMEGVEYERVERPLSRHHCGIDIVESTAQAKINIANLKEEVKSLCQEVKVLRLRSEFCLGFDDDEGYRAARHRFLDMFRRKMRSGRDQQQIESDYGNAAADHGDAVADALLYCSGRKPRTDVSIMMMIYGLDPNTILLLNERRQFRTIAALNELATLKVDFESAIPVPEALMSAFVEFRSVVEDELEDMKLERDPSSAWNRAYRNYVALLDQHKQELRRANAIATCSSGDRDEYMSDSSVYF